MGYRRDRALEDMNGNPCEPWPCGIGGQTNEQTAQDCADDRFRGGTGSRQRMGNRSSFKKFHAASGQRCNETCRFKDSDDAFATTFTGR